MTLQLHKEKKKSRLLDTVDKYINKKNEFIQMMLVWKQKLWLNMYLDFENWCK